MIEELEKNIYRIHIPLPDNPLKELNSYFIRGEDRDLLIDTGFRCDACYNALSAALDTLHSDPVRRDILVTHVHADHSGMADLFVGPERHVYMSRVDIESLQSYFQGASAERQDERFLSEGFPKDLLEYVFQINPAKTMTLPKLTDAFLGLDDGAVLQVGDYRLQMISVPGHTPGNSMFWLEEQRIMFSGDHILFDITPNITDWPEMEDSLGCYLKSLKKAASYPVQRTFPAHRETGDYHARIDALIKHHDTRLKEAFCTIAEQPGLSAYEITGRMTWQIRARNWEEFPPVQKWFAVGECLSHLDYLLKWKMIRRRMVQGIYRYEIS